LAPKTPAYRQFQLRNQDVNHCTYAVWTKSLSGTLAEAHSLVRLLFDVIVGQHENLLRDVTAKSLGGFQVHGNLEVSL
jgi:hypothetical protein